MESTERLKEERVKEIKKLFFSEKSCSVVLRGAWDPAGLVNHHHRVKFLWSGVRNELSMVAPYLWYDTLITTVDGLSWPSHIRSKTFVGTC